MTRTTSTSLILLLASVLAGCFSSDTQTLRFPGVYRTTIQQGNLVTQEMLDRLRPGMTRRQVRFVLGEPVLTNAFRPDRWDYIYTIQIGSRERQQQRLTVWFKDDMLSRFEGNFLPSVLKAPEDAPAVEEAQEASAPLEMQEAQETPEPQEVQAAQPASAPLSGHDAPDEHEAPHEHEVQHSPEPQEFPAPLEMQEAQETPEPQEVQAAQPAPAPLAVEEATPEG